MCLLFGHRTEARHVLTSSMGSTQLFSCKEPTPLGNPEKPRIRPVNAVYIHAGAFTIIYQPNIYPPLKTGSKPRQCLRATQSVMDAILGQIFGFPPSSCFLPLVTVSFATSKLKGKLREKSIDAFVVDILHREVDWDLLVPSSFLRFGQIFLE